MTVGDIATTTVDGTFSVVYLLFNTIMNLTSQDAQVDCFRNAAAHLSPGGCFVIDVMVPELRGLPAGQNLVPLHVVPNRWGFDVYHDLVTQSMSSELHRGRRRPRHVHLGPVPLRVAVRTRPDGPAGRDAAARALGRLDPCALHR